MKTLLVTLFIGFSINSFSQATLYSNKMPAPGTSFIYEYTSSYSLIDTTLQGNNQVWDLSTINTTNDPSDTVFILDPSQTSFSDSFPGANYCRKHGYDDYVFYNLTSSQLERIGQYNINDGYSYNTNSMIELVFPIGNGVSNIDPFSISNLSGAFTGFYDFTCIADGSIMVPGFTYDSVILVRAHYDIASFILTYYFWYDADDGHLVFSYSPGNGIGSDEASYLSQTIISVPEYEFFNNIVFNNPVSTLLKIELNEPRIDNIQFLIYNSIGELVLSGEIKTGQQQITIDTYQLKSGLYIGTFFDKSFPTRNRFLKFIIV